MHTKHWISQRMNRVMPVMLSLLVSVSAMVVSNVATAKAPPAHHSTGATAKPKAAPTTPAKSPEDKKNSEASGSKSSKEMDAKEKAALAKEIETSLASASKVEPLALMEDPAKYLNKKVTFSGTFNRFADIGLDYKKAFRDSRDYVTFFVLRPDVTDHTIPLSEMKLFFPRKRSSEVMDLETGDKIQIVGSIFSTALDEPWVDVEHIKIVEKTEKHERKHQPEF